MFSFTIGDKEYLCPMGYGEITIAEYAAYMATMPPVQTNRTKAPRKKGFMSRLTSRLNIAASNLRSKGAKPTVQETSVDHQREFISHWLKCPSEIVDMVDDVDILAMHSFINQQWAAWKPKDSIQQFYHDGRLWVIDYSLDTLAGCDTGDLQKVMSRICRSGSYTMNPRDWGGVSLDIAASIMVEVKRRHQLVAPIIGLSILQHLKLDKNG